MGFMLIVIIIIMMLIVIIIIIYANSYNYNFIQHTFFVNLSVLISINEAVIALKYDCFVLNVTRPDPIGYLYLSVSIPKIIFINI